VAQHNRRRGANTTQIKRGVTRSGESAIVTVRFPEEQCRPGLHTTNRAQ